MKPLAQQTLYEILEVPPGAAPGEIDAAYARARALYGPGSIATYTLLPPEEAELFMARLEEARTTLLDPSARARYDERLAALAAALPAVANGWVSATQEALPPARPVDLVAPPPDEDEEEDEDEDEHERVAAAAEARPEPPPAAPAPEIPASPRPAPIRLEREVVATTPPPPASEARSPVGEATTWTGEILRNVREARGISLQVIAERTKVMRHHLENIEADRFGALPAPVYLRGILLGLARELRLDGQKVARSYLERMAAALAAPVTPAAKR